MYYLNYPCQTRLHSRYLIESSIALISQSLTLPIFWAFILFTLLIALMGFPRLGVVFYPETAHEFTQSKQCYVRHAQHVVYHYWPLSLGSLKG